VTNGEDSYLQLQGLNSFLPLLAKEKSGESTR